ncbi:MAG: ABC transporter ATP-binding protein [Gammaproteobacteria bacterium RIFCSPHIGHO2_12_FULL_63_22]|nr:MAG: ABC transporter ATP-binding protein [Gammaproteobacteria bacterium RIFCSPHIGHO2_12_FULL_63_22]
MHAEITRSVPVVRSPRVMQLEGMFDVPPAKRSEQSWTVDLPLEARPWQIGLIVGPSGCGKSTIARELFGDALVHGYEWPADRSVIDAFPASLSITDITGALSSVGFSSPPSWLRPFGCLSNGEQFRVTLARALTENRDLVAIDEFTSVVDRTVAQIGSAAVAKTIRRGPGKFVAISCHFDIVDWLDPDWIYEPATGRFVWRLERRRPPIRLTIVRVHSSAWQLFKRHHYLASNLMKSACCFVALFQGQPAAFTAMIHSPHANGGFWREHRSVCLPDFQGIGIGNALSEFVMGLFASLGKGVHSTTSHPSMIAHRSRSPLWRMIRLPSLMSPQGHSSTKTGMAKTAALDRLTASFRYVGPARPDEARRFGITPPVQPAASTGTGVRRRRSADQATGRSRASSTTGQPQTDRNAAHPAHSVR